MRSLTLPYCTEWRRHLNAVATAPVLYRVASPYPRVAASLLHFGPVDSLLPVHRDLRHGFGNNCRSDEVAENCRRFLFGKDDRQATRESRAFHFPNAFKRSVQPISVEEQQSCGDILR